MVKVQQKFFKTAGGIDTDQGFGLSTNCQRVFVAGTIAGLTASDFRCHVFDTINADNGNDAVIAGLDHNGCQKFFKIAGRPEGIAVSTDVTSNCDYVFVTGAIAGPTAIDFAGNETPVNSSDEGVFVAKLDNCGHQKFFVTAGSINEAAAVAGTSSKIAKNCQRLFVTMALEGTGAIDFNGVAHTLHGNTDIGVAGLDYRGHQKFFVTAGGANIDFPFNLAADDCHVFVTGFIQGPTASDFKGNSITLYGNQDIFVAGLSNCGTQKFFRHAGATGRDAQGRSISTSCGEVFVTGFLGQTGTNFNGDLVTSYGNQDIFVAKLNACGDQKFFKTAGGIANDAGFSIVDNEQGVFVSGFIRGPTATDFNGKEITNDKLYGLTDIFVAGLSRCSGKQKFFATAGSVGIDNGFNITANDHGIFVTGFISGPTATDFNGCPVKHLYGNRDIFVAKLDYCGHQEFFVTAGSSVGFNLDEQGNKIEVRDNEIYVTGIMRGLTGSDFCNRPVKHLQGNGDIFVARLDDLCAKYRSKFSSMPYVPR